MRSKRGFHLVAGLLIGVVLAACGASPSPGFPVPSATSPQIERSSTQQQQTRFPLPDLRFERISTEDGLPDNRVRCMLQDALGYMWFCTGEGVSKYDGYGFKTYSHNPDDPNSLKENRVEAIYQDRSSTLWVATQGGWLERFDREKDGFEHFELPSTVRKIYEDAAGTFWIGTDDPGLLRFDRDTGEFDLVWRSDRIGAIFEDADGVLWVGNRDGLLGRYDRELDQFLEYEAGYWVEDIREDHAGRLWIGTIGGGLARFDRETEEFSYHRHDPDDPGSLASDMTPRIHVDSDGVLWVGAYRGGLDRFDTDTGQFTHYQNNPADSRSLSGDQILSIYKDRSGVFWVGTELGGVNKLTVVGRSVSHFRHIPNDPNSLGNNSVTAILEDHEGVLWVGTRGGLDRFDRASGQWRHFRHDPENPTSLSGDYVSTIYEDRGGALWIGTASGLDRYDPKRDQFVHYPLIAIYGIYQDRTGTLWVTADDGLYQFDQNADRFTHLRDDLLSKDDYWSMWIWEDPTGELWIGTAQEGLGRYDPRTGAWQRYQHDPDDPLSLSHNFVESLLEDRSGVLWIGTHGGLNRFDYATEAFRRYRVSDGLPSDTVLGILEDDAGNLWLSTNQGLSRFEPHTETFRNYDAGDGLQGNQFNRGAFYQSASGEMFFGGNNGFNAFYPEQITDNPHPPPVLVTAFSIFNQVVRTDLSPDEQIELTHRDNFVSFDFAALDYNNPEKNQYAYWMEGLDEHWVQAGTRRHADYPNLRPGDYVFHVKGSNNNGVWNEEGTTVHISIQPPFWATWWFRGILLLALAAVAFSAYRLRVRSVEARSRELEVQVTERTAELEREVVYRLQVEEALRQSEMEKAVTAERSRLARELHDAVTQTLFSASLIAEVLPRLWAKDPKRGQQQLEEVRILNRGALAEMRSLLLELRPEALAQAKMDDLLRQLGRAMTGRTGVPVSVSADVQCPLPAEVQVALYRIAQEALNNAAKHAEASQVGVHFQCEAGRATLAIDDDGQGFDVDNIPPGHLGLGIMEERASAIGAVLDIKNEIGSGTRLQVVWTRAGDEEPVTNGDGRTTNNTP